MSVFFYFEFFYIINIIRVFIIINLFDFGLIVIVPGISSTTPNKALNVLITKFSEASFMLVW